MTSALDKKGLEAARRAIRYLSHPETPWSDEQVTAVVRAYLSTVIPAEIAGVAEKLKAFAAGCRGSMWQSRDETIRLMDEAAILIERLAASQAEREEAARQIVPYLRWTIGPESPGHHPTMPSAVAAFMAAYGWDTEEKWHEARIRSLIDQPSTEGGAE